MQARLEVSAPFTGPIGRATSAAPMPTGIAFLTGGVATASYWLLETFPALGRLG